MRGGGEVAKLVFRYFPKSLRNVTLLVSGTRAALDGVAQ